MPSTPKRRARRTERVALAALAVLGALHALAYAWLNPPFEAPDEVGHLAYVVHVAQTGQWPDQSQTPPVPMGHHHPLPYHGLAAVAHAVGGAGLTPQLVAAETPVPWRFLHPDTGFSDPDETRAFRLLRSTGALLAALTVWLTGLAARKVLAPGWRLLPPFLVACLPQFAFLSGSLSNDPWVACAGALATLGGVEILARGRSGRWTLGASLALWAKKSGGTLLPTALVAATLRRDLRLAVVPTAVALLVALPLAVRNQVLYGDPLGKAIEAATYPDLLTPRPLGSRYFLTSFPYWMARSWFGHFGWMSLPVPVLALAPAAGVWLGGALGAFWAGPRLRRHALLCGATLAFVLAGVVVYNLSYTQPQGRLLFPALSALALLLGVGAQATRVKGPLRWLLAVCPALTGVGALATLVRALP